MKQIDADRLLRFLNDWWLSETPDERMSEAERSEALIKSDMIEDFMGFVETWSRGGADWHTGDPPLQEHYRRYFVTVIRADGIKDVEISEWRSDRDPEYRWSLPDYYRVIAWAELPEEYKGDEHEKPQLYT